METVGLHPVATLPRCTFNIAASLEGGRACIYHTSVHLRGTLENRLRLLSIEVSLQRTPFIRPGALESVQWGTWSMRTRLLRLRSVLLFVRPRIADGLGRISSHGARERERERERENEGERRSWGRVRPRAFESLSSLARLQGAQNGKGEEGA